MKREQFKNYLINNGKSISTAQNRIANCQNVENYYSDLDVLFKENKLENLIKDFDYSVEDERQNSLQKHKVKIEGNIRTGSATLKNALKLYLNFLQNENDDIITSISSIENLIPTNFRLESDLENAIYNQISILYPDYKIFEHNGKLGKQFIIPNDISTRRIDILLEHKINQHLLVIEVKGREISREVFGQISEYLVLLQEYFPNKEIKGCLIGNDFADNIDKIVKSSKFEIMLQKYNMGINLDDFTNN